MKITTNPASTADSTDIAGDIPEHGRIAVIPARGGSQRIPRKNLCLLYGRPLIWYAIEVARRSGVFSRIIVSTEDAEIADVSRSAGAEVLDRDPSLAQESTTTNAVLLNVLEELAPPAACQMVLLQPPSPFRTPQDLIDSIALFEEDPNALSLVSFCEYEFPAAMALRMDQTYVAPVFPEYYTVTRRTNSGLPNYVRPNGAIYVARCGDFLEQGTFYTQRTIGYEMPPERSFDIDTPFDLQFANWLLEHDPPPDWRLPPVGHASYAR